MTPPAETDLLNLVMQLLATDKGLTGVVVVAVILSLLALRRWGVARWPVLGSPDVAMGVAMGLMTAYRVGAELLLGGGGPPTWRGVLNIAVSVVFGGLAALGVTPVQQGARTIAGRFR